MVTGKHRINIKCEMLIDNEIFFKVLNLTVFKGKQIIKEIIYFTFSTYFE